MDYYRLDCEVVISDPQDNAFGFAEVWSCEGEVDEINAITLDGPEYTFSRRVPCSGNLEYCIVALDKDKNVSTFQCLSIGE